MCVAMARSAGLHPFPERCGQIGQIRDAGKIAMGVCASHIEEQRLHASSSGAEVVDRVDVPDIDSFTGSDLECVQRGAKNPGVRLFAADMTRIRDAEKALAQSAAVQQRPNAAVGIRDYSQLVL